MNPKEIIQKHPIVSTLYATLTLLWMSLMFSQKKAPPVAVASVMLFSSTSAVVVGMAGVVTAGVYYGACKAASAFSARLKSANPAALLGRVKSALAAPQVISEPVRPPEPVRASEPVPAPALALVREPIRDPVPIVRMRNGSMPIKRRASFNPVAQVRIIDFEINLPLPGDELEDQARDPAAAVPARTSLKRRVGDILPGDIDAEALDQADRDTAAMDTSDDEAEVESAKRQKLGR